MGAFRITRETQKSKMGVGGDTGNPERNDCGRNPTEEEKKRKRISLLGRRAVDRPLGNIMQSSEGNAQLCCTARYIGTIMSDETGMRKILVGLRSLMLDAHLLCAKETVISPRSFSTPPHSKLLSSDVLDRMVIMLQFAVFIRQKRNALTYKNRFLRVANT